MIGFPFSSKNCLGLDLVCILRPEPPAKMTAMFIIEDVLRVRISK